MRLVCGERAIDDNLVPLDDPASPWEASPPVLLNTWKHHAAALRRHIRDSIAAGPAALDELAKHLVVIGTDLMDLYLGALSPRDIGERLILQLHKDHQLSLDAYRAWIADGGGFRMRTLAADGSQWVLRMGDKMDRYIHIHPARAAAQTCRLKANLLKTAVMILAYTGIHESDPLDLELVNRVRRDYLGLPPLGHELANDQGIGRTINLLRPE
jgi:hypothetical protein